MTIICPQLGHVGRLGNQLYELAATLGIGNLYGQPVCLPDEWDYREWFSIPAELFGRCGGTPADHFAKHIDERARVYLQDYNLFADIMPTLRRYLAPSRIAREIIDDSCAAFLELPRPLLAVHIRRGDNVSGQDPGHPVDKHLWHPCPPLEYYERAIDLFDGQYAAIATFGDEPEWNREHIKADYHHAGVPRAKEHLPEYRTEPAVDWLDWMLLAHHADFHVLSNSTFGIFAGLIADDAITPVVPWPIYGPKLDFIQAELLFPDNWRRLTY